MKNIFSLLDERKLWNIILEKKQRWLWHILRGENLVIEVIEGWLEGKRVNLRIMMQEYIKADETCEKIH